MERIRSVCAVVVVAVAASLLSSCTPTPAAETDMTPEESKQSAVDVLDSTIAALGTDGWEPAGAISPLDCTMSNGDQGVNYVVLRSGPGADPEETVATVDAHWQELGMTTRTVTASNSTDTLIRLYGEGDPLDGVDLYADVNQTSIQAESRCVAGDAGELIQRSE